MIGLSAKGLLFFVSLGTCIVGSIAIPSLTELSEDTRIFTTKRTNHSSARFDCLAKKAKKELGISVQTDWVSGDNKQSITTQQQKTLEEKEECKDIQINPFY